MRKGGGGGFPSVFPLPLPFCSLPVFPLSVSRVLPGSLPSCDLHTCDSSPDLQIYICHLFLNLSTLTSLPIHCSTLRDCSSRCPFVPPSLKHQRCFFVKFSACSDEEFSNFGSSCNSTATFLVKSDVVKCTQSCLCLLFGVHLASAAPNRKIPLK